MADFDIFYLSLDPKDCDDAGEANTALFKRFSKAIKLPSDPLAAHNKTIQTHIPTNNASEVAKVKNNLT